MELHRIFDTRSREDKDALQALRSATTSLMVFDSIMAQIEDLVKCRQPGRQLDERHLKAAILAELGERDESDYGTWVYYPWSGRLVHLLYPEDFVQVRTNRNQNKINKEEQARLSNKTVCLVGLSVGHAVAIALAMERGFGVLRIADFDVLDLSNLNRIGSAVHQIGTLKTEMVAQQIAELDPFLKIEAFPAGLSKDNMDEFLTGADIVIDECDSIDVKIELREEARARRIPVVMETSDRGMLDIERFDQEPDRELLHGLVSGLDSAMLQGLSNAEKIPYVNQILQFDMMSTRMKHSLPEIGKSINTWPQLAADVVGGGGRVAQAVRQILLGQEMKSGRYYHELAAEPSTIKPPVHGTARTY
jgi:molybdopterin/thiamine biosynthesis adenylyltransferase